MADYTAIYSVGSSIAAYLQQNYLATPEVQASAPATQFQLVSSAQIAEEDTTSLTKSFQSFCTALPLMIIAARRIGFTIALISRRRFILTFIT